LTYTATFNTSMIGTDYQHPTVRLPGSGGANDLASFCWKTLVITRTTSGALCQLDFLTTPGYLTGPARESEPGCHRAADRTRSSPRWR